ncbi:cobalamin biosynthesis protein CbiG [Ectothiorhodospira haloalkaliphila]|uniref:Cobalamin biosynthesis protein CbiG n=1 Tax=Ectothiorhodospira haloalkaliphila TaxID=421628 RepID=W8KGJ9_9GAMM|nr:cobalamin biosynthesis protein [Ectothiorhodospira haloalkaliphila]AHK78929.1 cobalamin biosynthesis protein CbiG [Ectothiorhodospira haloalkaliphila]MCG5524897.1 cobalamin biosynthesis protein [Ectothiorhodospira haloalkaliphila]
MSKLTPKSLSQFDKAPSLLVGIGCQRGISREALEAALHEALGQVDACLQDVVALATLDARAGESAITTLASERDWTVHAYPGEALAGVVVPRPSERLRQLMGTASVAEAAAILASGAGQGRMILEKYPYRGADGGHVTVAVVDLKPSCVIQ